LSHRGQKGKNLAEAGRRKNRCSQRVVERNQRERERGRERERERQGERQSKRARGAERQKERERERERKREREGGGREEWRWKLDRARSWVEEDRPSEEQAGRAEATGHVTEDAGTRDGGEEAAWRWLSWYFMKQGF
jgi:hypothetical protein